MSDITLIQKIKEEAAKNAADIKANATAEVEAIQRETEAKVADVKVKALAALEKEKAQRELVAVSQAKQSAKISVQKAKRKGIDTAFDTVCDEIAKQPSAEYVAFFVKHAKATMPENVTGKTVEAPKSREVETADILNQLGITAEVQPNPSITAGFILRAGDGVYDVTLERIMNEKRAELELAVMQKVN